MPTPTTLKQKLAIAVKPLLRSALNWTIAHFSLA